MTRLKDDIPILTGLHDDTGYGVTFTDESDDEPQVKKRPDAYLYLVCNNKKSRWVKVGAAYMHKDGLGYKLLINAYPAPGYHIVMREEDYED